MSVIFGLSSCDLGEKFLKSHGVEVINLKLNIKNKLFNYNVDRFDFSNSYEADGNAECVKLEELIYEKLSLALSTFQDVVFVTPSKLFGSEFNIIQKVASNMPQHDQKVFVVDSGLISVGYASVLFEIAVLNSTGISTDELVKKIPKIVKGYKNIIIPSATTSPLISKFAYAKSLGVKPIISLSDNKMELIGTLKGKLNLINEIKNHINQTGLNVGDFPIGVMFGKSNASDAKKIVEEVANNFETKVFSGNYFPLLYSVFGDSALIISFHKRND